MVFGDRLTAATGVEAAAWLHDAVDIRSGTVGGLVPRHYESHVLVDAAPPQPGDWWDAQRQIVVAMAEVLTRFTDTPDRSWFAIWEGHGFDSPSNRDALRTVPRFELPHRTYYLLAGRVLDVERIMWPGEPTHWFRPDLWWPDDRQWFVGTDVDFWCNYVGGSRALTEALARRLPGIVHPADRDDPLRSED